MGDGYLERVYVRMVAASSCSSHYYRRGVDVGVSLRLLVPVSFLSRHSTTSIRSPRQSIFIFISFAPDFVSVMGLVCQSNHHTPQ